MQSNWQLSSLLLLNPLSLMPTASEDSGLDVSPPLTQLTYSPAVDESPSDLTAPHLPPAPTPHLPVPHTSTHLPRSLTPHSNPSFTQTAAPNSRSMYSVKKSDLPHTAEPATAGTQGEEVRGAGEEPPENKGGVLQQHLRHLSGSCEKKLEWRNVESKVHALNCRHVFHRECFKQWRRVNDNCPLCRAAPR